MACICFCALQVSLSNVAGSRAVCCCSADKDSRLFDAVTGATGQSHPHSAGAASQVRPCLLACCCTARHVCLAYAAYAAVLAPFGRQCLPLHLFCCWALCTFLGCTLLHAANWQHPLKGVSVHDCLPTHDQGGESWAR